LGGRGRWISEFEASLVYRVSSRTPRATQRNPVLKKKKKVFMCPHMSVHLTGKRNKLRVYYLSWLRNKILHNDPEVEKKQGWTTVGDMEGCGHYRVGEDATAQ
jgi:hypothetical protein